MLVGWHAASSTSVLPPRQWVSMPPSCTPWLRSSAPEQPAAASNKSMWARICCLIEPRRHKVSPLLRCPALLALLIAACTPVAAPLTRDQLLDPEQCKSCHPTQFADWQGSMHAYASDDPVFLA